MFAKAFDQKHSPNYKFSINDHGSKRLNVLSRSISPWAINQKILPGPNRVKRKYSINKKYFIVEL